MYENGGCSYRANLKRQRAARRLEVTLHARLELALAVELRRGSQSRGRPASSVAGFHRIDVRLPGSMATLAVDALGQRVAEFRALEIVSRTGARG